MISGFNTDIEYNGTTYHVQTEDKGAPAHMIMSLVYDRGTILASKRVSYRDLDAANFDVDEIAARINRQHTLICAAVKAGRINELKKMDGRAATHAPAASPQPGQQQQSQQQRIIIDVPPAVAARPLRAVGLEGRVSAPAIQSVIRPPQPSVPMANGFAPASIAAKPADPFAHAPIIDAVKIVEDVHILPADAVEVVSELSGRERSANQKLTLELLGESRFKGGDRRTVQLMVCRGTARKVIAGAQIMVKVLGSSFRPVIFHSSSDANGLASIHLQVPRFHAGRAALLVRVIAEGEETELRRLITPG